MDVDPGADEAPVGHAVHALAPAVAEYAPAGQFVHGALPRTFLNVPATHAVQASPSGPVYPMLHLQSDKTFVVCVNGVLDCTGHEVHPVITKEVISISKKANLYER